MSRINKDGFSYHIEKIPLINLEYDYFLIRWEHSNIIGTFPSSRFLNKNNKWDVTYVDGMKNAVSFNSLRNAIRYFKKVFSINGKFKISAPGRTWWTLIG